MKTVLIISILIKFTVSIETSFGGCPKTTPLVGPELENLSGKWYDIAKHQSIFIKGKCMSFDVNITSDKQVTITSNETHSDGVYVITRQGSIEPSGALEFCFTFINFSVKFYVLDADADNYLLGFACKSMGKLANVQMAWIWGRNPELPSEYIEKAKDVLQKNGISTSDLTITEHGSCH